LPYFCLLLPLAFCLLPFAFCLFTLTRVAAGGDPEVGRPGVGRCSAGWLMARRDDVRSSRRAGEKTDERLRRRDVRTRPQSCFDRSRVLDPHERAVARLKQKLRIDQGAEELTARGRIEAPQATGLRLGQTQPGHFEELSLDAAEHIVSSTHWLSRHVFDLRSTDLEG
jgi:hypothetical protein